MVNTSICNLAVCETESGRVSSGLRGKPQKLKSGVWLQGLMRMGLICLARKQFVESRIWTFYSNVFFLNCQTSVLITSCCTRIPAAPSRTPEVRNYRNQSFNYVWCGRRRYFTWHPNSRYLSPSDISLWGYMKNRMYASQPADNRDLRDEIADPCQFWTTPDKTLLPSMVIP